MTEKAKKPTATSIKHEVNKLIKQGLSADSIKYRIRNDIPQDFIDDHMLFGIIDDTILEHPNYELIQSIMHSELAINQEDKSGKIHCFLPEKRKEFLINKEHVSSLFHKFDYSANVKYCMFHYRPDKMCKFFNEDGQWYYNLFQPPFWMENYFYDDKPIPTAELPEIYQRYFMHFTNHHKPSYDYVLDWLANSLRDRNYCILTAIANQGVGKGVMGEIMRVMWGSNFDSMNGERFNKEFNGKIKNKRAFFIDELKINSTDQEDRIKVLINDFVEVEDKNVSAETIRNYASIYVASNNMDAIRLRGDDRRFSIIEMSDKKLIEVFSSDEISSLLDRENVLLLARYLWHRPINKEQIMKVFVTERTEQIRQSSLRHWEEFFIEEICYEKSGEVVKLSDMSDLIENNFGSRFRPAKAAFQKLQELYPDRFKVVRKRENDRRIWSIEFGENK